MPTMQALGHKKHRWVINRVGLHFHQLGIHDFVMQSWAQGGNEYYFATAAGRRGEWNPKTDALRFYPPDAYTARLIAEGNALTCPGGRTASLCRQVCVMLGMAPECVAYEKTHPRRY